MSRPITPAELRAEATRLREVADGLDEKASMLEAVEQMNVAVSRLTTGTDRAIVPHNMQAAAAAARPPRKVGRPVKVKHRFRSWLEGQGLNVSEWAESHRCAQSTVRAWMRPLNDGGRKIPEGMALRIQHEAGKDEAGAFVLPATAVTWPNGFAT